MVAQVFEDLDVWRKAMDLAAEIYGICRKAPLSRDYGFRDQMQRAAVSIPANIAEGYERDSDKEYIRYVFIAKGSSGELRCLLRLAHRLGYLHHQECEDLVEKAQEISRMLNGLIASIKRRTR
jgi:four helix bundle protein